MGSPSPLFYGVICYNRTTVVVPTQVTKKMVSPAAIREKSQRGVALNCDVQVVSAKSVAIRQPCNQIAYDVVSCGTFFSVRHFCAGNSACAGMGVCVCVCVCMYVILCICVHVRLCARACGCTYTLVSAHLVYLYCPISLLHARVSQEIGRAHV